ncbi:MAG: LuxR C-terminal-related transcriptional regulator [Paracoccus sp. (in: a-proteobacteria)]
MSQLRDHNLERAGDEEQADPNLRILLIDDHPLFLDAMQMTLADAFPGHGIRVAYRLSAALDLIEAGAKFDLLVLDLNLPDVKGVDGLIRVKSAVGATPVVVVSSLSEQPVIDAVLAAGAIGFVPKHSSREQIVAAIGTVLRKGVLDSGSPAPCTPDPDEADSVIERMKSLTPQQGTILHMICLGKMNKQIAFELDIAETTVKAHVTAILRKMKAHSRTHAVSLAQKVRFDTILPES